ncbi:polyribonucleotide nucleotidyltransferase [Rhodothalassium salexigens]|uniref:polyribonucleotide nucleotidyltransferase n=1 Tax=Rhodothalassium salexigens TaxID=1086 RepID=UPI0019138C47|nr:polyribonucleotide nucleotidyltransferase [Rhodothalassium salexigens]MBK5911297.1 polyribonucleotide nucleotidyltransferase [Rhodothalassium salexigens]MBK5921459.1 polyribonucleotide nucleotidyltransferase [Rhodothalassium salexigens]
MFDIYRKTLEWGGRTLTIETGHIARQADGAVLATYGETAVLCTVCAARSVKPGQDFFPLTVNYQEKTYAAGKIPGGFFKREGRPSEKETLTSRLIDRPIRPLFPGDFKNDTQVICTVLSHDMENDPDVVAMIGASAALTLSGIPFLGPIAGARVGYSDGQYILNPTLAQMEDTELDLVVAGTQQAVLMVESEAKELDEETMLGAVMFGHKQMQPVVDAIIELAEEAAKEPWDLPEPADHGALEAEIRDLVLADLEAAYQITEKQARTQAVAAAKDKMVAAFEGRDDIEPLLLGDLFKGLEKSIVRGNILDGKPRIDGRALDQVRPILSEVEVLPRSHGSALFTRGETQALVVVTLGTGEDEQIVDALSGSYREHFMLHYNFPPYSVGETGRVGFTGRREIGHGKLAYRAIKGVMPTRDAFPYTIRVVSEITESNGSSSMATVCGTSLALMDAGVPITRPVSGIAMGLIKDGDRFAVLSDILGDEDHLGDMDFKVAGTDEGITSLQMDIKITGITEEIMSKALAQAKGGRDHIMGEMGRAISDSRTEMSRYAPRIETISIPTEKIREVIGTGGKVIREIVETTGAKVDIEDDGTIKIASADGDKIEAAKKWITGIVAEPEIGHIYDGKVVRIMDFGAFVNFIGTRDGLVHISELTEDRVNKVTDVVNEGDMVKVKVLDVDDRGKVRLSMRLVNQETGEELEDTRPAKKPGGGRKG